MVELFAFPFLPCRGLCHKAEQLAMAYQGSALQLTCDDLIQVGTHLQQVEHCIAQTGPPSF